MITAQKHVDNVTEIMSDSRPRIIMRILQILLINFVLSNHVCLTKGQMQPSYKAIAKQIKWMRAEDIAKQYGEKPVFFQDGPTRFDINQGRLGDCWFLATLADLPSRPALFNKVVDPTQSFEKNPSGIFRFNFWQDGEWIEVTVNDYLPTLDGKLFFASSDSPNEFWSALLEKAYAKLYGNYKALSGGLIAESLEDLTGGVTESFSSTYDIGPPTPSFEALLKAYQEGALLAFGVRGSKRYTPPEDLHIATKSNAIEELKQQKYDTIKKDKSTFQDPLFPQSLTSIGNLGFFGTPFDPDPDVSQEGLVGSHVYAITKVVEIEIQGLKHQLVRLYNPFGNQAEWTGAWSDNADEWNALTDKEKSDIGFVNDGADGEFFMSYQDLENNSDWIDVSHVSFAGWHKHEILGSWTGPKNPHYILVEFEDQDTDSKDTISCLVSLVLTGGRRREAEGLENNASTHFFVVNITDEKLPLSEERIRKAKRILDSYWLPFRSNTERFEVQATGRYIIVPETDSAHSEFLLRVFSEIPFTLELIDSIQMVP